MADPSFHEQTSEALGEAKNANASTGAKSAGRKKGSAGRKSRERTITVRKSCDFCYKRKKKCNGDGVNRCSLCIAKKQPECIYSLRQPQRPKSKKSPPTHLGQHHPQLQSGRAVIPGVAHTAGGALLQPSLKRCRLSISPATGLVGTQENNFLNDFFNCMGFLPLTCQSTVREAMVKILVSSMASPMGGPLLTTKFEQTIENTLVPAGRSSPVETGDPSTCMFWCAVALGGLTQGRPIESVACYIKLAKRALAGCGGAAPLNVARAWALMAYLYGFCGHSVNFHECQRRAETLLHASEGQGATDESDFEELLQFADGLCLFYGNSASAEELELYVQQRAPHPQMGKAATQSNIRRFVMESYHRLGQAFFTDMFEQGLTLEAMSSETGNGEYCDDYGRELIGGGDGGDGGDGSIGEIPGLVVFSGERAVEAPSDASGNMRRMMEQAMPEYERLESAVDGPGVRGGIGGLMINCTLVVLKTVKQDLPGAVERITRCVEVLVRYPGLLRFPMGLHISHLLISALASLGEREMYEQLRAAYHPMRPAGDLPFPPFEEWQGIGLCCTHVYCRAVEGRFKQGKAASPASRDLDLSAGEAFGEDCGHTDVPMYSPTPPPPTSRVIQAATAADASAWFDSSTGMTSPWPRPLSFSSGDDDTEDEFGGAAMASEDLDPIVTPAAYGCLARPVGVGFEVGKVAPEACQGKSTSASALLPALEGKVSFGNGGGVVKAPTVLDVPRGDCGEERGDIDGGNDFDAVAEVAETYLLSGSDEEGYHEMEQTVAEASFLDITDALLRKVHANQGVVG